MIKIHMPVGLTDEDIAHPEHEAHEIISMYPWHVIWAIGAVLGWNGLGGAEYRRETAEREREEADANA